LTRPCHVVGHPQRSRREAGQLTDRRVDTRQVPLRPRRPGQHDDAHRVLVREPDHRRLVPQPAEGPGLLSPGTEVVVPEYRTPLLLL
jgi:hypothetical protein